MLWRYSKSGMCSLVNWKEATKTLLDVVSDVTLRTLLIRHLLTGVGQDETGWLGFVLCAYQREPDICDPLSAGTPAKPAE